MEASLNPRTADSAKLVLASDPKQLHSRLHEGGNGWSCSAGWLTSVPLLAESYAETKTHVDSHQQEELTASSISTSHQAEECKMLITGPPNDSQKTVIPYDIDIHGNSLDIDATCLKTENSFTPPPSSVSSHLEYRTMSCTDGGPGESIAETENSNDDDRTDEGEWEYPIPSDDIPLDAMETIVQRAVLLLKLTPENPYAHQELSECTCLLGVASSRVSPEVEIFRHSGHHYSEDAWRAMEQDRSAVRRQYAQALLLFYRSDALWGIPIIHAMLLQKQMLSEGHLLFTIGSITNAVLEDFRHEFTCHIWYAAIRWLASIVITGKLPRIETMGDEQLRLKFWEMQLNDEALKHILWVLRPGLDIDGCLKVMKLKGWLYTIVIQLIDDLFSFKLGRMSDLIMDEYIIARFQDDAFRQAMKDMWGVEIGEIPVGGLLAKGLLLHSAKKD